MKNIILFILISLLFISCSGSKETTEQNEQQSNKEEVYVFDDNDTKKMENKIPTTDESENKVIIENKQLSTIYFVQVGAYTTRSAAENFMKEVKSKLKYNLNIIYDDLKKLYIVQIDPAFQSKKDAENVRNELWKISVFKDAWVREETN